MARPGSAEQRWPQLFKTYPRKENTVNQAELSPRGWRIVGELAGFDPTEAKQFAQIVKGESGFRPGVLGHDPGGSTGIGGPQNTPAVWGDVALDYLKKLGGEKVLTNPYKAAKMARFLYEKAGNSWSPWYGTRYLDRSPGKQQSVLPGGIKVGSGSVQGGGSSVSVPVPTSKQVTEFDSEGYEQAQKMQLLATFLSKPKGSAVDSLLGGNVKSPLGSGGLAGSSLFKTGLLSTDPVSQADFMEQRTVTGTRNIKVPGAGRPGGGGGGGQFAVRKDGWKGAKSVGSSLAQMAKQMGLSAVSEKRGTVNTASGGVSDHYHGNKDSYAWDLSNGSAPTPEMDKAAKRIMRALGEDYDGKSELVRNVEKVIDGRRYRFQILYRTQVGGNHDNHIHLGVDRVDTPG